MKAITCLFQLIPLIIIIASVYFTLAIIRGKVKVRYNTHSKYIYWFMPTLLDNPEHTHPVSG